MTAKKTHSCNEKVNTIYSFIQIGRESSLCKSEAGKTSLLLAHASFLRRCTLIKLYPFNNRNEKVLLNFVGERIKLVYTITLLGTVLEKNKMPFKLLNHNLWAATPELKSIIVSMEGL